METKEGEKNVLKLERAMDKKIRDSRNISCIKGDGDKVLVEDTKIRERWRNYFSKLVNS